MAAVNIGFIGAGGIAERHLAGLSRMDDVRLAAFTDVDENRAEKVASQYSARYFTDPNDMFAAVKLDGVYICLPPFAHGAAEFAAITAGVPFLVEKPLGMDLDLAKQIEQKVVEKGLLTAVGYMNRYRKGVQLVRRMLQNDPAILAYGGWLGGTPQTEQAGIWKWWVQKSCSGGQLVEQTTHTIDLIRYLLGEITSVYCQAATGYNQGVPNYTIEDASICTLTFQSGALATIFSSCATNVGGGISLTVYAQNSVARFTGWNHTLELQQKGQERETIPAEENIFALEDRAFIDMIKTADQQQVQSSYADGVKTLAVTLAGNRSMETGERIVLE